MAIEVSKRSGTGLSVLLIGSRRWWPLSRKDPQASDQLHRRPAPGARPNLDAQGNISTAMFLVLTVVVAAVGVKSGLLVAFGIVFIPLCFYFRERAGLHLQLHGSVWNAAWAWNADRWCHCCGPDSRSEYDRWTESQPSVLEGGQTHVWPIIASVRTTLAAFLPLMLARCNRPVHAVLA